MRDFEKELKKYRFWNRLGNAIVLSLIPLGLMLYWLVHRIALFKNFFVIMPFLLLLLILSFIKTSFFRCPRCKKSFIKKNWYSKNTSGRCCVHCGLSAYKKN